VLAGAILSGLGGYLAHRFGSLSIGVAVGIAAGGTAGTLLLAIATLSSSKSTSSDFSSTKTVAKAEDLLSPQRHPAGKTEDLPSTQGHPAGKTEDLPSTQGHPAAKAEDLPSPQEREARKTPTAPNPSILEQQLNTGQVSEAIRLRAISAAKTLHGQRFDPNKQRIAFICETGQDASQVAYALFQYAYPTMELLPPHGSNYGFDPEKVLYEPRCAAPNASFFAAIGKQPVPKFGEKELGTNPLLTIETDLGYQKMRKAMDRFYSGCKSKTTVYLVFGSQGLHNTVAKKIRGSRDCILCQGFHPIGTYEEIANQIIDAIANGLFWPQQAQH